MKISVVTISFNQAQFLRECIDSVLDQDYPNIQYIVVDPGSTDGSREIIDSYGSRITKVYEKDDGPADGLNKGFARAIGDIFYFINSDDYVLPNAFSKIIHRFESTPSIEVLLAGGWQVNEHGDVQRAFFPSKVSAKAYVNGAVTLFQQGLFFRAELFKSVGGFNVENKASWDGELLLAFMLKGANFDRLMEQVGVFRIYPESITGSQRLATRFVANHKRMFQMVYGQNQRANKLIRVFYRAKKLLGDPIYLYKYFAE